MEEWINLFVKTSHKNCDLNEVLSHIIFEMLSLSLTGLHKFIVELLLSRMSDQQIMGLAASGYQY